ncbi:transcriptional regulator [Schleiferilactobacillus shenzhenensis]|nr:transcriptional regulator [Schleiferilactobacillus shenzhenensis]
MSLLPINEEESRVAADEQLSRYREERGIMTMPINPRITSSWGDGMSPSTAERDPYPIERMERIRHAKGFIRYVDRCIHALPKRSHQRLLRARYCDGPESDHPDATAMQVLDISSSSYFRLKSEALLAVSFYLGVEVHE